jgi:hypothetical protein
MRTSTFHVILLGSGLALAACGPNDRGSDDIAGDDSAGDDSAGDDSAGDDTTNPPAARCQAMDIVFVVDDSGSMTEEQSNLAANFPQFAQVLDNYEVAPGQPLDYRVALTTTGRTITTTVVLGSGLPEIPITEQGDNGAFRAECGSPKRWIDRTDGNLGSTLACRANVGTNGPGAAEMPLYAGMLGLSDRIVDHTNEGFLRDDALLAVVMITDEDDCSRTDDNITMGPTENICAPGPAGYVSAQDAVEFYDALKGGRGRWAAAVVAGATACSSGFGDAAEAVKLKQFVSTMNSSASGPQNGVFASICDGNMATSLQQALDTFQAACESFPPIE